MNHQDAKSAKEEENTMFFETDNCFLRFLRVLCAFAVQLFVLAFLSVPLQAAGDVSVRAAVERNQRECKATTEVIAQAGPLRRGTLPSGNQFAQDSADKAAQSRAACDARTQVLREQLQTLEKELAAL